MHTPEYNILSNICCFCLIYRCGVIQEGDRIIAVNGQYLEGRTMDEIYGFIAESPVKMILTVEFRVAGKLTIIIHYLNCYFTSPNSLVSCKFYYAYISLMQCSYSPLSLTNFKTHKTTR